MKKPYKELIGISKHGLHDKTILIIGAGFMAEHYCIALKAMGIKKVVVIAKTGASAERIHEKYNFRKKKNELFVKCFLVINLMC